VVFHVAGWYEIGSKDWKRGEAINVDGTRNVLGLAQELNIPKIIYTSTIAVNGDTHGELVDETFVAPPGPFLTEYDRTKWIAHYEVALPLIEHGAPIIIVMPGVVYGPGDHSLVGDMMVAYYRGLFPVLPGPEFTLTFAHVDDIAEGHILAAEKGIIGESYILAGPAVPMGEMVKLWSAVSGRRSPLFYIPARFIKPLAPLVEGLNMFRPLPPILSRDTLAMLEASYAARSDKARVKLGWQTRPLEEGMRESFDAIANTTPPAIIYLSHNQRRQIAAISIGAALGLMVAWLVTRRKRS
jgi:nucleoside-diphosphate-sugar epimerase